jgi:hypothetical protein
LEGALIDVSTMNCQAADQEPEPHELDACTRQ